jgi:hypothetical protein
MSTIKVRKQSLDRIGLKTAYLLYNELLTVRLMVNCWFDGDRADLHKKEYAQFLRRLVVRALKEMCASETHDFISKVTISPDNQGESYGGTSSDESSDIHNVEFLQELLPVEFVRTEYVAASECAACSREMQTVFVVRHHNKHYLGLCGLCYQQISE